MEAARDPESQNVPPRTPPQDGRIPLPAAAAVHTILFASLATSAALRAIWVSTSGQLKVPRAAIVVMLILALKSFVMMMVGPTVLNRNPRGLLTSEVFVRPRSPLVKAMFSLSTMGLSWLVVEAFGMKVSKEEVEIMVSVFVYVLAMVRVVRLADDGGVVDSMAGSTFGMMMSLPSSEVPRSFRVSVGAVLGSFTILRAGAEYLEQRWRRRD